MTLRLPEETCLGYWISDGSALGWVRDPATKLGGKEDGKEAGERRGGGEGRGTWQAHTIPTCYLSVSGLVGRYEACILDGTTGFPGASNALLIFIFFELDELIGYVSVPSPNK